MPVPILLITGSTGVGKTAVSIEVSLQLGPRGIPHALIDSDALDSMYPGWHEGRDTTALCVANLSAMWQNFAAAGAARLVMAGVFASLRPDDLDWIIAAIPGASLVPVRLIASDATICSRLERRETGSGLDHHLGSARRFKARLVGAPDPDGTCVVDTSRLTVEQAAGEVITRSGWLPENR